MSIKSSDLNQQKEAGRENDRYIVKTKITKINSYGDI